MTARSPRPDTRVASLGDRYTVALVTTCPWAWSSFLRRCADARAEVQVYTCPIAARALIEAHEGVHRSMLVTILCPSVIADAARYAEGDADGDRWVAPVVAYTWGRGWPDCGTGAEEHYRAVESLRRGGNVHGDLLGEDALVVIGWGLGWWDARMATP